MVDPLEHLVVDVLLLGAFPLQTALLIDICLQVFTTYKATFRIARHYQHLKTPNVHGPISVPLDKAGSLWKRPPTLMKWRNRDIGHIGDN